MPALQFPTEYTSRTGEIKYLPMPSRPFTEGVKTNNITHSFESGHEQRRVKGDPKRTFEFTYNALDEEQANVITKFFIQCYGNVKAFFWTHPLTKESIQVRFDMDALIKENFTHTPYKGAIYKMNVKLVQAF